MSSWWTSLFGGGGSRTAPRDAIVGLRENLLMLDKKEQHLTRKMEEQQEKARTLVASNRKAAAQALRQKKVFETELERLYGTRMTLETQVAAIESANMNFETMQAMKRGSDALKQIHGSLNIDKVDATMDSIREQMDLTNEISEAISNPVGIGQDVDEVRYPSLFLTYETKLLTPFGHRMSSNRSSRGWNKTTSTNVLSALTRCQPMNHRPFSPRTRQLLLRRNDHRRWTRRPSSVLCRPS